MERYSVGVGAAGSGYADAARDIPAPIGAPGTFPGLLARLESLVKKSHSVRAHAEDVRERVDGTRAPPAGEKSSQVQAVKSGFISQLDEMMDDLNRQLNASDDALEHVWSKVS